MRKKNNTIWKAFDEVIKVSPLLFFKNYLLTFLQGILNAIPIWCLQLFLDHIIEMDGSGDWRKVWGFLFLYISSNVAHHIVKGFTDYNYEYYDLLVGQKMIQKTNQKAGALEPIAFEESSYLDMIEKAYRGTSCIRDVVDTVMMTALYYIPELMVVVMYLYSANPFLPIIVILIIFVVVIAEKIQSDYFSEMENQIASMDRKVERFSEYICDLHYYKETKIRGLQTYFLKEIRELFAKKQHVEWKFLKKTLRVSYAERSISVLGHIIVLVILFLCAREGTITVGVFAAVATSLGEMFGMIEDLVGHISGGISESLGKARNYFALQNIFSGDSAGEDIAERTVCSLQGIQESVGGKTVRGKIESITLKNVSFSYPNQQQKAIRDVSVTISNGDHIVIVGENGSGKSTLVKLIAGLYSPTSGEICINGIDSRQISRIDWRHNLSAIFQSFGRYQMTVRNNIVIGDPGANRGIGEILNLVSFFTDADRDLQEETLLSREFGGTDISGGQWQKLATARGFFRDREWMIMDEPTSAIDPIEEGKIISLLQRLSAWKTSIIVTHRLGSVKYADKILVMKEGSVAGFGSHDELLEQCEEYKKIWESQAQFYQGSLG